MAFRSFGDCTVCGKKDVEITYVNDDDHVCDSCLDDLFQFCDMCQEYYSTDGVEFTELDDGRTVCEWCMEDLDSEED